MKRCSMLSDGSNTSSFADSCATTNEAHSLNRRHFYTWKQFTINLYLYNEQNKRRNILQYYQRNAWIKLLTVGFYIHHSAAPSASLSCLPSCSASFNDIPEWIFKNQLSISSGQVTTQLPGCFFSITSDVYKERRYHQRFSLEHLPTAKHLHELSEI